MFELKIKEKKPNLIKRSIVIGHEGKKAIRKYVYGHSEKEVLKKITKIRVEFEKGLNIAKQGDTFKMWAKKWESIKYDDLGYNTINMYKAALNSINPIIGDIKLSELKLFDIQTLVNNLYKKGKAKQTLKVIRMTISQILQMAVKNDIILRNICDDVTIPAKAPASTKEILTQDEIEILNKLDYQLKPLVLTMLYTGVRRGEALALTWEDINISNKLVSVNKAIAFQGNSSHIKTPKTFASIRTIPIPDMLIDVFKGSVTNDISSPIFYTRRDRTITQENYKRVWKQFQNETGIKITAHQLRHTYITMLYNAGIDAKQAQQLSGHADIKTLLSIYTHLQEKNKIDALNKLNLYLKG